MNYRQRKGIVRGILTLDSISEESETVEEHRSGPDEVPSGMVSLLSSVGYPSRGRYRP